MTFDADLEIELKERVPPIGGPSEDLFGGKPKNGIKTKVDAEKELFDRGKEILGRAAGGMIANLLRAKEGNVALARAAIEQASTKQSPREFVGGVIRGAPKKGGNAFARLRAQIEEETRGEDHDEPKFNDAGNERGTLSHTARA